MKKLFVSVPMRGRTDEAISNSINEMFEIAKVIFGNELELIETHIPPDAPEGANTSIWCLGRSIQKLSEADYYIGLSKTYIFKGCAIENQIVEAYSIPHVLVDITKLESFGDIVVQL